MLCLEQIEKHELSFNKTTCEQKKVVTLSVLGKQFLTKTVSIFQDNSLRDYYSIKDVLISNLYQMVCV